MRPHASVSPAERRATRDVRRRRPHLRRKRAALLAPGHNTTSPSPLPESGKKIADTATRAGGAARFEDRAGQKPVAGDLARIPYDDERLQDRALLIWKTAQPPEPQTRSLLHTVPGMGKMLRLGLLYAIPRIARFPSVPEFASYARLGKGRKELGGPRVGTAGKKSGNAPLTWAFSEAAPLCVRHHPQGQKLLARLEKNHATGQALSLRAQHLGRAVSCMRTRPVACDMARFLQTCGSSAGEPRASRDPTGMRL